MPRNPAIGLLLLWAPLAAAQVTVPEGHPRGGEAPAASRPATQPGESEPATGDAAEASSPPARRPKREADPEAGRLSYPVDPDAYSIISTVRGLSTHKATYIYPLTWSAEYRGNNTEMVLQFSAKQRVFGSNFYIAYTQRSFWQYLNQEQSSPFRETNYDPELFYRFLPEARIFNHWGADIGFEHESNGRSVGESRSWNRVYVAPFQAKGRHLAYLKFWYRIPEGRPSSPTNPDGDDNPDITDFMGHGELQYSQQIGGNQLLTAWVRGNTATHKGAFSLTWSIPSAGGFAFYGATLFHGYGESLIDYDEKTTRLMVGVLLAR